MQPTASYLPTTRSPAHQMHEVVTRLQKSAIYRDYQQAFQTTTGLPLAVRAVGSFQPPLRGSKQANPFCEIMAS